MCIDATTNVDGNDKLDAATVPERPRLVFGPPSVLRRPNRNLIVAVIVGNDNAVAQVTLSGSKGTSLPATMSGAPAGPAQSGGEKASRAPPPNAPPPPKINFQLFRFAPRVPGDATLSVSFAKKSGSGGAAGEGGHAAATAPAIANLNYAINMIETNTVTTSAAGGGSAGASGENAAPKAAATYEYLVQQQYSGALRFGLSGVFTAQEHAYGIRKAPGSMIGSLVDNGASPFDAEVVAGYAPFVFNWDDGGRSYGGRSQRSQNSIAPYIGLGLVSGSASGVSWLKSLYLGLEYELGANCSIAGALVLRRVDRLAYGLSVGDPVADGTTLTTSGYAGGFGVVLNFTPDFVKFATSIGAPK